MQRRRLGGEVLDRRDGVEEAGVVDEGEPLGVGEVDLREEVVHQALEGVEARELEGDVDDVRGTGAEPARVGPPGRVRCAGRGGVLRHRGAQPTRRWTSRALACEPASPRPRRG